MNLALTQTSDCSLKSEMIPPQIQLCFISEHLQETKKKLIFFKLGHLSIFEHKPESDHVGYCVLVQYRQNNSFGVHIKI